MGLDQGTEDVCAAVSVVPVRIRRATVDDAARILAIYQRYVETTATTFERVAPSVNEMCRRISSTLERYPYLVADRAGDVVGFTYAGPLRGRPSYDWSVETTIYVAEGQRGTGVGRMLYEALEAALSRMGVLSAYACIACTERADAHLTDASLRFHERVGYSKVGEWPHCGNKFGKWYNVTWVKKDLGAPTPNPAPVSFGAW